MELENLKTPPPSLAKITFLIYALHLFSAINGLLSPALIITAFLTGWPSIIALVMCYIWKDDATSTYLASHFEWLIKTFWWALIWLVVSWLLVATVILSVIGLPMMLVVGVWVLYRLFKGIFALNGQRPVA